jgi:hypothetical protein
MTARMRLFRSPLTGRIYATADYTVLADGTVIARTKWDVTDDYSALLAEQIAARTSPTEEGE